MIICSAFYCESVTRYSSNVSFTQAFNLVGKHKEYSLELLDDLGLGLYFCLSVLQLPQIIYFLILLIFKMR